MLHCSGTKSWIFATPWAGLHARLLCPPLSPGVCSNSCLLSRWCHPTILSSVTPLLLLPSTFPSIRVFSSELALHIRWSKYWNFSFSMSPSMNIQGWRLLRFPWLARRSNQSVLKEINSEYSFSAYYYDNLPRVPTGKCIYTYRFWTLFLLKISTIGPQFGEFIDILEGERRQGPLIVFSHFFSPPSLPFTLHWCSLVVSEVYILFSNRW